MIDDHAPPSITTGWGEEWKEDARIMTRGLVEKYRGDGEADARFRELVVGVVREQMARTFPRQESDAAHAMMAESYMGVIQRELERLGL